MHVSCMRPAITKGVDACGSIASTLNEINEMLPRSPHWLHDESDP
jgi:hypothetical protein